MGEPLFCSTMILKSRLACSTGKFLPGPEPLLVAAELSLTPLLWDESEHTEADSGWFDGSLLVLLALEEWVSFFSSLRAGYLCMLIWLRLLWFLSAFATGTNRRECTAATSMANSVFC